MQNIQEEIKLNAGKGLYVMNEAIAKNAWGIASAIDIYNCNPETIRDADAIRRFVVDLCDLIEMKRFGETQVVHFGEGGASANVKAVCCGILVQHGTHQFEFGVVDGTHGVLEGD